MTAALVDRLPRQQTTSLKEEEPSASLSKWRWPEVWRATDLATYGYLRMAHRQYTPARAPTSSKAQDTQGLTSRLSVSRDTL